eukprot:s3096_g7.t1
MSGAYSGTMDWLVFDSFAEGTDGASDRTADASGSTFTEQGMIERLFERCNRRHEQAVMQHDAVRAQQYGARRATLPDFTENVTAARDDERQCASDALGMVDDISEDPGTPAYNPEEDKDEAHHRARNAHSAIALQGAMSMQ